MKTLLKAAPAFREFLTTAAYFPTTYSHENFQKFRPLFANGIHALFDKVNEMLSNLKDNPICKLLSEQITQNQFNVASFDECNSTVEAVSEFEACVDTLKNVNTFVSLVTGVLKAHFISKLGMNLDESTHPTVIALKESIATFDNLVSFSQQVVTKLRDK